MSEETADQIMSLPMFAGLQSQQQDRVAEAVAEFASIRAVMYERTSSQPPFLSPLA